MLERGRQRERRGKIPREIHTQKKKEREREKARRRKVCVWKFFFGLHFYSVLCGICYVIIYIISYSVYH